MRVIYSQHVLELEQLTGRQRRWEVDSELCVAGSGGSELFVDAVPGSRVVRKHRFDVWQSEEFLAVLDEWNIDGLIIGGVGSGTTCRSSTRRPRRRTNSES